MTVSLKPLVERIDAFLAAENSTGMSRELLLRARDALADDEQADHAGSFQSRVQPWMLACFGAEIAADTLERADRFVEEALELVQATGYSADRAHALVDYVFGRTVGKRHQEVGGVMVTLAALCLANNLDMHQAGEDELARVWTKVDQIRQKQAAKPKGSALPVATADTAQRRVQDLLEANNRYLERARAAERAKAETFDKCAEIVRNEILFGSEIERVVAAITAEKEVACG